MKFFLLFSLLFLGLSANAQYKTLTLKSGADYRYTKLHFVSDDTLFFKAKSDHINYKVATADLTSSFYLPYGKYHHFNRSSKNLKPLKIAMGVGLGLMLGGAGAARFLVPTKYPKIVEQVPCRSTHPIGDLGAAIACPCRVGKRQ